MSDPGTRFRVFVYTAVDGYEWQGCTDNRHLSAGLDKILSNTGVRNKLPDPNVGVTPDSWIGGILKGELEGRSGIAIWRAHVRSFGERAGRRNRYIALLFLPDEVFAKKGVDFVRLWDAPFLATPQADGLNELGVDLSDAQFRCNVANAGEASVDEFPESVFSPHEEWLAGSIPAVAKKCISPEAQFGNFVANVRPGKENEPLRVHFSYAPATEVVKASETRPLLTKRTSSEQQSKEIVESARQIASKLETFAKSRPKALLLGNFARTFSAEVEQFASNIVTGAMPIPANANISGQTNVQAPECIPAKTDVDPRSRLRQVADKPVESALSESKSHDLRKTAANAHCSADSRHSLPPNRWIDESWVQPPATRPQNNLSFYLICSIFMNLVLILALLLVLLGGRTMYIRNAQASERRMSETSRELKTEHIMRMKLETECIAIKNRNENLQRKIDVLQGRIAEFERAGR